MKVVTSIIVEYKVKEHESMDEAKENAIQNMVDYLDDWLNEDGLPPIIQIEYKIPDIDESDNIYLN
jgi:hypothetical protein